MKSHDGADRAIGVSSARRPPASPAGDGRPVAAATVAALSGAIIAAQGQVNADLAGAGLGVVWTGWASYAGTLLVTMAVIVARRRVRRTVAVLRDRARWWWFAIGLCSVPIVYAMSYGVGVLGVALASVCSVAGQTISGTLLDARGVGLPAPIRITGRRALAGVCAIVGLTAAMLLGPGGVSASTTVAIVAGLSLFAGGFLLVGQQSGNGRVTHVSGDSVVAGLTSVTGGFIGTTVVVAVVTVMGVGPSVTWPDPATHWVLYLGGPLGAAITIMAAWSVRHLGSFALTLAIVGGQLLSGLILDAVLGVAPHWGTALAVVAVAVATFLAVDRRASTALT